MERAEVAVHPRASEGIIVTTNGVLTECSMCNVTKKSRRDHKVFISHSDNLWEWSDWENEGNKKIQEGSQDDKSRVLPEELVEKILSMVPFPYVFKARVLSKSWLARLSPISSQDDVEEKRRAIVFQKQIRQWSPNWKVFCPVHDFRRNLRGDGGEALHGHDTEKSEKPVSEVQPSYSLRPKSHPKCRLTLQS